MNTIFLVLCGTIIASAAVFGILLLRVSLDDQDFWLKSLSAVLATLVLGVGTFALIVSHRAGKELEGKLDAERLKRIELLKTVARRQISFIQMDGKTNLDGLKPFAENSAVIEFLPQVEPRRVANDIAITLRRAGWTVEDPIPNENLWAPFFDGVVVQAYEPPPDFLRRPPDERRQFMAAQKRAAKLPMRLLRS
jgi:hypothetical protein